MKTRFGREPESGHWLMVKAGLTRFEFFSFLSFLFSCFLFFSSSFLIFVANRRRRRRSASVGIEFER